MSAAVVACANERGPALSPAVPSGPKIDPNAEPLPPETPNPSGHPAMKHGVLSRISGDGGGRAVRRLREGNSGAPEASRRRASASRFQRGFHAKSHACLTGHIELDKHRDPRTRYGVFADDTKELRIITRFSNGVGWRQEDSELDAQGFAIKVLDVPGPKYISDEPTSQDFLMTNAPVPVGRDAVEFMKFARANTNGKLRRFFFLVGYASTASGALSRTAPVDSMVTERYWSGGVYHLGAHQAVKYSTRPCDLGMVREPARNSDDYLRDDLVDAAKSGLCFTLNVQFQTDPEKTPIEIASKVWEESDSPLVRVGKVILPPQNVDPTATAACDSENSRRGTRCRRTSRWDTPIARVVTSTPRVRRCEACSHRHPRRGISLLDEAAFVFVRN